MIDPGQIIPRPPHVEIVTITHFGKPIHLWRVRL